MLPHDFDGNFRMTKIINVNPIYKQGFFESFKDKKTVVGYSYDYINKNEIFEFFRRVDVNKSLESFHQVLPHESFGYDKIEKAFYYKGKDGTIYQVDFSQIHP